MLHEAKPERLADVRKDPRFEGWPDAHPDMSDFLGMPITDGDEILGALFLANKRCPKPDGGCGFTAEDEELLSILAQHAAIALTNARLYERSRELTIAEERSRIAHELHDAVSQKLFSLRLTAQAAAALVDRDPARAKGELQQVAVARRRSRRRTAGRRRRAAPRRPRRGRPDRHPAHPDPGPGPGPRAQRSPSAAAEYAPCPPPRRRRCSGSRRRPCTTRCATPAREHVDVTLTRRGHGDRPARHRRRHRLRPHRRPPGGPAPRAGLHARPGRAASAADSPLFRSPARAPRSRWRSPVADKIIRVLLVDDHQVVRRGLRTFLEIQDDIEVVGEAVRRRGGRGPHRGAAARRRPHGHQDARHRRHRGAAQAPPARTTRPGS